MADRNGLSGDAADTGTIHASAEQLASLLYPELRRAARGIRARVSANSTLQTTALLNEAYLKLARGGQWSSRHHFLASAAVAMRHVLVDQARARVRLRRGEGAVHVPLDAVALTNDLPHGGWDAPDDLCVAVGDALAALSRVEPRLARVVECRFFAGYTDSETAAILGLTTRTVRRDWVKARAWLRESLSSTASVAD